MNGTDLLTSTQNGIQYLVCSGTDILAKVVESSWIYPIQEGSNLLIQQVYNATQSSNILEVQ